ncbi:MAG TPA: choice-of-anchor J domain-containing protein [Ignavibacteria bacterium]|nr:choice-of-anchor J domain-containing protein [Ignavibacteria bacterium]
MKRKTFTILLFIFSIFLISAPTSEAQYKLNEGFEDTTFPPAGWTRANISGSVEWVRSTAQKRTGVASAFSNYDASEPSMDWLISKRFVPGVTDSLTFYARRQYSSNYPPDSMFVFISNTDSVYTSFSTVLVEFNTNEITSGTWNKFTVYIGGYSGQTCWIGFRHQNYDGNGIFIDDVTVGEPVLNDVGVTANNAPTGTLFTSNTQITPNATIRNFGTLSQIVPFNITYQITGPANLTTTTSDTLAAGTSKSISFPDNFTPNVAGTYNVTIYTSLVTDQDRSNDTLKTSFTVSNPKDVLILNADQQSADSLMSHMNQSGYAGKYDVLTTFPNVSFSSWQTLIVLLGNSANWSPALRDSMKSFLDNAPLPLSGSGVKKTFMIFSNDLGYYNDPRRNASAPAADTVFYRQYLRSMYWGDNWLSTIAAADSTFNGVNDFSGLNNNYVTGSYPDFVMAVNGGSAAFVPATLTTNDTANAVYYAGSTYNMFYGTNQYWAFRPSTDVVEAPINVFQKIAEWIENNGGVLPVELSSFTASVSQRDVNLNWSTAEEINNSGFDIERKTSDGQWTKAGFVTGSGTTHETKSYSFTDRGLNTGKYNYRLKQIDYNGNFEYYNLSSEINVGIPNKFDLSQNYPNPFNPVTKINYDLPLDGKIMLKIYDITGREVAQLVNEIQTAGYYTVSFNASSFASGVYFYRLFANGNNGQQYQMTKKMMLIK